MKPMNKYMTSPSYRKRKFNWKRLFRFSFIVVYLIISLTIFMFLVRGIFSVDEEVVTVVEKIEEVSPQNEVIVSDSTSSQTPWKNIGKRTVTMYTSTPSQTDASPCIGATGDICKRWLQGEKLCATNEFPFNTQLFIWGDFQRSCLVVDRMNERYTTNIDFYNGFDEDCLDDYQPGDNCPQLWEAQNFGSKEIIIEKYEHIIRED